MDRYDRVAYESMPVAEADPSRLFAIGQLFGLTPPKRWRVLEVGCGAGGHLVPLAARNPSDTWVGFDLATLPVQQAQGLASRLDANVQILQLDLCEANEALESLGVEAFDLIVAHGVYSWVPENARAALWALCERWLAPEGIAYVSANCLPGWGLRGTLAGMLRFVSGEGPPEEQIGRARAFMGLLTQMVPATDPYGAWLRREADLIAKNGDPWVFHDLLAPVNQPVWLHEVVARGERHGLQYLGDAVLQTMLPDRLPASVQATLASLGGGQVQQEQLLDFVLARPFRRMLFCREEVSLQRELQPEALQGLHVRGRVARDGDGRFRSLDGDELQTDSALLNEVLGWLADHRPATMSVNDLSQVGGAHADPERVRRNLLLGATRGLVELRTRADRLVGTVTIRPVAEPVARQLCNDGEVPSVLGRTLRLDTLERVLLQHLDGSLDVEGLVDAVLASGFVVRDAAGDAVLASSLRGWLRVEVPQRLRGFAREGLLVG